MANFGNPDGSGIGEGDGERFLGRGRGRKSAQNQPLRRPHQPGGDRSEVVRNSVLSVDAAEFVPKSVATPYQPQPAHHSSVQERLNLARQSANVPQVMVQRSQQQEEQPIHWQQSGSSQHYQQFSNSGYQNMQQYQSNQYNQYQYNSGAPDYGQYDGGSGDFTSRHSSGKNQGFNHYLNQLEMGVRTLTMNPGKFDSLVASLVNDLIPFLDKPEQCKEIFNLLLQQSIDESNFRYSGARLCTHLDTVSMTPDQSVSIFRETIINKCKQKTDEQIETWRQITNHTDKIERECHGLIFFLAELVNQMESAASSLGKLLIQLINTVLQNPGNNSTKNICQALKLAGGTLERENSELKAEMELVMRRLSDLVVQGRVDIHVSRLVSSVTELRSGNWVGQFPSSQVEEKQSSSQAINEPVYFGPDGQVLTEEERIFLEGDMANNEPISDPWENDENADEIAEAFEEFLQFSQNNNRQSNQKNVQNS